MKTIPTLLLVDLEGTVWDEHAREKVEGAVKEFPTKTPIQTVNEWWWFMKPSFGPQRVSVRPPNPHNPKTLLRMMKR